MRWNAYPSVGGRGLRKKRFRATANERILIHLLDYVREREEVEFSSEITQAGIAEILGTRRSHVSLALSSLKEKGFVKDRLGRVEDEIRRRKVYFLTHKGFGRAKELKANFLKKEIQVPKEGAATKVRIEELDDFLGEDYFLIDVLSCINSEGVLDMNSLTGEPATVPEEETASVKVKVQQPQEAVVEAYKPPTLADTFIEVSCSRCGMRFLIMSKGQLTEVYTRCPNCSHTFKPFVSAPAFSPAIGMPKKKELNKNFLNAGLVMIALTIIFPIFLGPIPSSIAWIPTIILAVIFVASAFENVEELTRSDQKHLIGGCGFLLFFLAIFVQVRLLANFAWETLLILLIILQPFLVLWVISRRLPEGTLNEVGVIGGVSLLGLGLLAAGLPSGMAWASRLNLYFVVFGTITILLIYNKERLKHFRPETVCMGIGIPIFISAMSWLILLSGSLDTISLVAGGLWLLLGLLLINVRFLPKNLAKRMVETLKSTTPFSIGAFFIIFGLLLVLALRYVESVVPFVVGIPVALYGIDKPAKSPRTYRIALFVYATILTLATLYPVFYV
ncbi:MAG: winged helix-turn-helix domain-containing protein [Methanobacteriota archaeon]|nr:MAG: winged helix-turn-helix domain-containing protein [Euryarchaeota archaeon]